MSQQQDGSNQEVAGLAQAVRQTQRRRSSRQQQTAPPESSRRSSRLAASSSAETGVHPPGSSNLQPPGSSRPQPQPQAAAGPSSRWTEAKEVKIINNTNTENANKRCMKAFTEFLHHQHAINEDPATMEQPRLVKLLADFITRVSGCDC